MPLPSQKHWQCITFTVIQTEMRPRVFVQTQQTKGVHCDWLISHTYKWGTQQQIPKLSMINVIRYVSKHEVNDNTMYSVEWNQIVTVCAKVDCSITLHWMQFLFPVSQRLLNNIQNQIVKVCAKVDCSVTWHWMQFQFPFSQQLLSDIHWTQFLFSVSQQLLINTILDAISVPS